MKQFRIQSNRKYCADIPGSHRKNNLQTIIYPCHNGPNQKFLYNKRSKTLKNVATKKCLSAYKGKIVQKRCSNRRTQKFERRGKKWVNLATKKCIDVEGGEYGNEYSPGKLIDFSCHSGPNQQFNTA